MQTLAIVKSTLVVALALGAVSAAPRDERDAEPLQARSPEEAAHLAAEAAYRARVAMVEAQYALLDRHLVAMRGHRWAGEYSEGDGLGFNVRMRISPVGGVAATWHGCLGLYGANVGDVVAEGDRLRIAYRYEDEDRFMSFPAELVPVRWGARRYLLAPDQMESFVAAINMGWEPRGAGSGSFLLAEGDTALPVQGLPDLPMPWRGLVRQEPLDVTVTSFVASPDVKRDQTWYLTVDRGRADGLATGEYLEPLRGCKCGSMRITTVEAHTAIGELSLGCGAVSANPEKGWTFRAPAFDAEAANERLRAEREDAEARARAAH